MNSAPVKFGSWTVLEQPKNRHWPCRCDCGTQRLVDQYSLKSGSSAGCGCVKAQKSAALLRTHGLSGTPEFHAWCDIRARCCNPTNASFGRYGGRGIKMCARWLHGEGGLSGMECFLRDVGKRPAGRFSIERIDTNGNYEPINCKWIPLKFQSRNRRVCKTYNYKGETLNLADIRDRYGVTLKRLQTRLELGWSISDAIERPTFYRPAKRSASPTPAV